MPRAAVVTRATALSKCKTSASRSLRKAAPSPKSKPPRSAAPTSTSGKARCARRPALHPRPRDRRPHRRGQGPAHRHLRPAAQGRRPHPLGIPLVRHLLLLHRRQPADALPERRSFRPSQDFDQFPYLLGGCAEYHYVPVKSDVIRIPDNVSSPQAASAACALRTFMHGFELLAASRRTRRSSSRAPAPSASTPSPSPGTGARTDLVIGAPASRLEVAKEWGADDSLNIDEPDQAARRKWVLDRTGGRGADIVIQCATGAAIPEAWR